MVSHAQVPIEPRPPRALQVVRDPRPEEIDAPIDWSAWYLTDEEDMGESNEQSCIIDLLKSVLSELARERRWESVLIGGNQYFAWIRDEPLVRVSPDVYLLDDPPPPPLPRMWETWRGHRPPRFAVEIVSARPNRQEEWEKDYAQAPEKYAQLGTGELVIFDPEAAAGRAGGDRCALQLYRRQGDGSFVRVQRGAGPAWSSELDAWLVVAPAEPAARLRISRNEAGTALVPTEGEALRAAEERTAALERELAALRGKLGA